MKLASRKINDLKVFFRTGTSDERMLAEVIDRHCYRRSSIGFDVLPGERWLDFGANIGAFGIYCKLHKATALSFEPDWLNFRILKMNITGAEDVMYSAVSASKAKHLPWFASNKEGDFSRQTSIAVRGFIPQEEVPNTFVGDIRSKYDGIKMDIEGAEGAILDSGILPSCDKLVLEYHTSRDRSLPHLRRRLEFLRSRFKYVKYPPEYDRAEGKELKTFFDRLIFCWEAK